MFDFRISYILAQEDFKRTKVYFYAELFSISLHTVNVEKHKKLLRTIFRLFCKVEFLALFHNYCSHIRVCANRTFITHILQFNTDPAMLEIV